MHGGKAKKNNGNAANKHNGYTFQPDAKQLLQLAREKGDSFNAKDYEMDQRTDYFGDPLPFNPKNTVQARLKIGQANDKFEKEADTVADKVVSGSESKQNNAQAAPPLQLTRVQTGDLQAKEAPAEEEVQAKDDREEVQTKTVSGEDEGSNIQNLLQRSLGPPPAKDKSGDNKIQAKRLNTIQAKCSSCGKEESVQTSLPKSLIFNNTPIQRKCTDCEAEDAKLQKKTSGEASAGSDISSSLSSSKGKGSQLDEATRYTMESGIGADFGGVRVHTDSQAVQMNQQLGAQAFTNGNDVYFNEGKYNPSSKDGQHLLAHELTHTVQQGASGNQIQRQAEKSDIVSSNVGNPRLTKRNKTWLSTYFNVSNSDLQHILKDPDPRPVGYDHYPRENAEGYLATMIDIVIKQNGGEQFPPLATPGYVKGEPYDHLIGQATPTTRQKSVVAPALSGPYNWISGGQYNVRYWDQSNDRTLSEKKEQKVPGTYHKKIIPERRGQAPGGHYSYTITSQHPKKSYSGSTITLEVSGSIQNNPGGETSTVNSQIHFSYPGGKFSLLGIHQYESKPLPDPYEQPGNEPEQKKKNNWWWDQTGATEGGKRKEKNKNKNSKGGNGSSSGGFILKLPDWLAEMNVPYPDQASYEQMSQEERESLAKERFWQEFSLSDVGAKILVGLVIGLGIFGAIALAFSSPVALIAGGVLAILMAGVNLLMDADITVPDWIKSGLMVIGGALLILAAIFEAPIFIIGAILVGVGYGIYQIFNAFFGVKDAANAKSVEDFKEGIENSADEAETGFADTILSLIPFLQKLLPKRSWFSPKSPGSKKEGSMMDKLKKIFSGKKNNKDEKNKTPEETPVEKSEGVKMTVEGNGEMVGGRFVYGDGKVTEYLANRKVVGDRVEFTDIAFYPEGAVGNEMRNTFGRKAMFETFEAMKAYATSEGFKQVRIHFRRGAGSSSANPGKVFDKTFDL